MFEPLSNFLAAGEPLSASHRFLGTPELLWVYAVSGIVIALACYVLTGATLRLAMRQPNTRAKRGFVLLAVFMFAAGTIFLVEVLGIWRTVQWLDAGIKVATAAVAVAATVSIWPLLPAMRFVPGVWQPGGHRGEGRRERLSSGQEPPGDHEAQTYRLLFETNPIPMWVRDPETNGFLAVNDAAVKLYGYSREEFLGMTGFDLRAAEDRAAYREFVATRDAGATTVRHWRHRKKDGTRIDVEVTACGFEYQGRLARLASIKDVTDQVRAERELQESEQRYRDLFDLNPSPMMVFDVETLAYVAVNEAATSQYGYTKEEFSRMTILDLFPEEDRASFQDRLKHRDPRTVTRRELRHRKKEGNVIHVATLASPLPDPRRRLRIVLAEDITQRKRTEEGLRDSEQRLRTVVERLSEGLALFDHDDRLALCNEAYRRMQSDIEAHIVVGTPFEEIARARAVAVVAAGKARSVEEFVRERLAQHRNPVGPIERERPDGGCHLIWEARTPRGETVVAFTDITELKNRERALRESEERYRRVVEMSPSPILLRDGEYVSLANPAALRFFGAKAASELAGKRFIDLIDPDHRDIVWQRMREIDTKGEVTPPQIRKYRRLDGTAVVGEACGAPLHSHGRMLSIVTIHDVTEQTRAADAIRRLNLELEQRVRERTAELEVANKELESFAYSVSHDLRAPLRSIDGFSRALLEDYRDRFDDTGRDYLRRVRNATQRMGNLIDDLLTLSRITRSEMRRENVNLSAIARDIAAALQRDDPQRDVKLDIQAGLRARADANLLRVALENLLHNAWKFSGRAAEARIEVGATRKGDRQVYFVRDNGVGFDMSYAEKLFGAFQRLHSESEFPGTGVGLATVQRIVRRHGGEVWAEAAVGEGATFYFTLGRGAEPGGAD